MAAMCGVAGAEPTHYVIERIETFAPANYQDATVYDVLCLPADKPFVDHQANYNALLNELAPVSPSGCVCVNRKAAVLGRKFQSA
jgi:hypothetical protein